MAIALKVKKLLDTAGVAYTIVPHKKVFTVYDLGQTLHEKWESIVKSVLVKVDTRYVVVIMPAHYKVDFKRVKALLKAKRVEIAKERDMANKFNVKAGAITPFGPTHNLEVVMDKSLMKVRNALFGAGSFTESVRMKVPDYVKVIKPLLASVGTKVKLIIQKPQPPKKKAKKAKRPMKKIQKKKRR